MVLQIRCCCMFQVVNISALWELDWRNLQPTELLLTHKVSMSVAVRKRKTCFQILHLHRKPSLCKQCKPLRVKCPASIPPEGQDDSQPCQVTARETCALSQEPSRSSLRIRAVTKSLFVRYIRFRLHSKLFGIEITISTQLGKFSWQLLDRGRRPMQWGTAMQKRSRFESQEDSQKEQPSGTGVQPGWCNNTSCRFTCSATSVAA